MALLNFKFEILVTTHDQTTDPEITFKHEYDLVKHVCLDPVSYVETSIEESTGHLVLRWNNKTESDTLVKNGEIVADKKIRVNRIWIDGILAENWILTNATYFPRYFAGFLEQFPDSPEEISSPYEMTFPGSIAYEWPIMLGESFWDWYQQERKRYIRIENVELDPDRVWKFQGSYDAHEEIVHAIEELIEQKTKK